MNPVEHPLCNDVLRRPPSMSAEECNDLPIMRMNSSVASFWVPTARELIAIRSGCPVILHFAGSTHPPVFVAVVHEVDMSCPDAPVIRLVMEDDQFPVAADDASPLMRRIAGLVGELSRCVNLLDGDATMPDGSNADTSRSHALLSTSTFGEHPVPGHGSWRPDRCPVTLRPFFCWIGHPEKGLVPTYGGPFDSYTIAEPDELADQVQRKDVSYSCERYDHDEGEWKDGSQTVGLRVVTDDLLIDLGAWPEETAVNTPLPFKSGDP